MKLQKTKKTSKLEQASTLFNKIDDSQLDQINGGCDGVQECPLGVPAGSPGGPWPPGQEPRLQRHNELN